MNKHKAFSTLIGKKNGLIARSSFSLSQEAVEALDHLNDNYQASFKDIARLIMSDYLEHKPEKPEKSCLHEIIAEMSGVSARVKNLQVKKTLSLNEKDLDALNRLCAEKNLNRNRLADCIIVFAQKCISTMENERIQNRKTSSEMLEKWQDSGRRLKNEIEALLANDEDASKAYKDLFEEIENRFKLIKTQLN